MIFDFAAPLDDGELQRLREQAANVGYFYARHPRFDPECCQARLEEARAFFAQPAEVKRRCAVYSELRNERDWREQLHLKGEAVPDDFETAGRDILSALARSLALPADAFLKADERPHSLLKQIHYLPASYGKWRWGVAPHVDFSWITLLLQDATGGLSLCTPQGVWQEAQPIAGTLVVNLGEVLQFATGGYFLATPHGVANGSAERFSLPFFLNPAFETRVEPIPIGWQRDIWPPEEATPIHRFLPLAGGAAFRFGEAELRRKTASLPQAHRTLTDSLPI